MTESAQPPAPAQPEATFDTNRRFVRVTGERPNGFIEFDFAIGEPELFVEMILSREAFAEFCAANAVEVLDPESAATGEGTPDDWNWRLADATHTRFR
jgi:phenol/toluene 2-monooxygenase (NADH) P0/A0